MSRIIVFKCNYCGRDIPKEDTEVINQKIHTNFAEWFIETHEILSNKCSCRNKNSKVVTVNTKPSK